MTRLASHADLAAGLDDLQARDPRIARMRQRVGTPLLRQRAPGYRGLAEIVVSQQISTVAAAAIWRRVETGLDCVDAGTVADIDEAELIAFGLSRPKVRTLKAAALAVTSGALPLRSLAARPVDEARALLTAVSGIGPWTAETYLLFAEGHGDAWPAGDIALQEAMRLGLALDRRPNTKAATELAEDWRPWRGVAAHLLWAYYRYARHDHDK